MSLEEILQTIQNRGEAQVRQIEDSARFQVEETLAQARKEALAIKEQVRAASVAPVARERSRIIHKARLQSLQLTGDVREALVDAALCRTRECLANLRSGPRYPEILRRMIEEALNEVASSVESPQNAHLEADPRDQTYIHTILTNLKLDLPVSYSLQCWGGVIAKSEDGRVVVINTLESRLARATPVLCRYLAGLFVEIPTANEEDQILEEAPAW
jgi:V/A-type H+-transporting ATPase subunit E